MKTLSLTDNQFGALYDIVKDAVDYIEGDLITTEDDNGNEILEDITEYEIYQVFQQLQLLNNETVKCESNNTSNVTYNEVDYVEQCITEGYDYRDCVDTLVDNMGSNDDNVYTHDSEGC
jgi:hypothetical protein